jgi:ribosomal protein S18 acetylase RimI-like enzyme
VIAAARHRDEIVAVCILKGVRPSYNASIAGKSKYSLRPDTPELGYAATHPQHEKRGLGSRLTQEVLKRAAGDVFATVRMTNSGEQRNLERLGFRREREHWKGDGQYNVGLWVRKKL